MGDTEKEMQTQDPPKEGVGLKDVQTEVHTGDEKPAEPPAPPAAAGAPTVLSESNEFKLSQTRKGCIQECFGCTANSEYQLFVQGQHKAMLYETSSCLVRFFCGGNRWWDTKMVMGTQVGAKDEEVANMPTVYNFHRTYACQRGPCKCCCYQQVDVQDANGADLGMIKEMFYYCVPHYNTILPDGTIEYEMHMPTCMGGLCVNCCSQGCCNCRVPFLLYPPNGTEEQVLKSTGSSPVPNVEGTPDAQITKIWSGFKDMLADAQTYEIKCPDQCTQDGKARLIAATLLLDQTEFEKGDDKGGGN